MIGAALSGTLGLVIVVAVCFGAFGMLFWMILGTGLRMREERRMAARMLLARSGTPRDPESVDDDEVDQAMSWIPTSVAHAGGKVATAGGFGVSLDAKLEQSGLPLRGGEFVVVTVLAAFGGGVLSVVLGVPVVLAALLAVAAGAIPYVIVRRAISKRDTKLQEQLPDVLTILASSLRAGHSFLQALDTVAKEIDEPAAAEFNRVVAEIRLGRASEEALDAMAERIGVEDFTWAVLAINIQREVGGNLAEILDTVAMTIRERQEIRRDITTLTTEGRLSAVVLIAMPFVIAAYMGLVNPDYIGLLFTTTLGWVLVAGAVVLMGVGVVWMRKVIDIDV
ncbi:MAG: type II secretion system F family protein [Actinomycetota bacterium]